MVKKKDIIFRGNPLCPNCLKKGREVKMHLTKLEELWHCKKCNKYQDAKSNIQGKGDI